MVPIKEENGRCSKKWSRLLLNLGSHLKTPRHIKNMKLCRRINSGDQNSEEEEVDKDDGNDFKVLESLAQILEEAPFVVDKTDKMIKCKDCPTTIYKGFKIKNFGYIPHKCWLSMRAHLRNPKHTSHGWERRRDLHQTRATPPVGDTSDDGKICYKLF